ncbi:MAG: Vitamin B12 import system permease protein BtuC [Steroidobacteraceae bacterium]|nr:Vitamin B12 import system permease protein BtuC [Steroidobacteraceae bacterium]
MGQGAGLLRLHPVTSAGTVLRFALLTALVLVAIAASLLHGSSGIGLREALAALAGGGDELSRSIVLEVRLPRTLAAVGVGSVLALAGVLLQALFRNPLADPYVLGVSGGAAVGALAALIAGAGAVATRSGAFAGAMATIAIVAVTGRGGGVTRLLLTGVVVASACGAGVAVLLALADSGQLRGMVFWLAGDLGWSEDPWTSTFAALAALVLALAFARPLNVLAAGERRAQAVGLDATIARWAIFLAAAALTSTAVITAGTVGFVGLVTPHAVRLAFRTGDHRIVAPAAALLGGGFVTAADYVARTIAAPRQLPVGAILALIGAPLFLVLLRSTVNAPRAPR